METSLLVAAVLALFFAAGYGPSCWLATPADRSNRVVVMPVLGFSYFLLITHALAALGLAGSQVAWCSLPLMAIPAMIVPKARRMRIEEWREAWPVLSAGVLCLLLVNWPLLFQGYRVYMGYANPDAAFNVGVWDNLLTLPYGVNPAEGFAARWPAPIFGVVFGSAYIGVFLSAIFGVDIHALHQVVCGPIVFLAPLGTWLLARIVFSASGPRALMVAGLTALSSQLAFTVCLQSLGSITLAAMLPSVLACWSHALEQPAFNRSTIASMLTVAMIYGYYASMPAVAGMVGVAFAANVLERRHPIARMAGVVAIPAGLFLLCFPKFATEIVRRVIFESTSGRLEASLEGKEILLGFGASLTESYLPFFWGLGNPQFNPASFATIRSAYAATAYLVAAAMMALVIFGLREARGTGSLAIRAQVALMTAAVLYFQYRRNAYGVFKFAAWWIPVFLTCAVIGAVALLGYQRIRAVKFFPIAAILGWIVLNIYLGLTYGRQTLADVEGSQTNAKSFRLDDFLSLKEVRRLVPEGEPLLVSAGDVVVQDWAILPLRRLKLSIIPMIMSGIGPDEEQTRREEMASGWERTRYVLTYKDAEAGSASANLRPIWENRRFRLSKWEDVKDVTSFGAGWYQKESSPQSKFSWQHGFRWLRRRGELIVLGGSGELLELRAVLVPGPGNADPARTVRLSMNGKLMEQVEVRGSSAWTSRPFRANGRITYLTFELDDRAKPIPKPFGLFNRWVPLDHRRLNIAVAGLTLASATKDGQPRYLAGLNFPAPDAVPGVKYNGIYADGWIATPAQFQLNGCGLEPTLFIDGFVPGGVGLPFPYPLGVKVNGQSLAHPPVEKPGDFRLAIPIRVPADDCAATAVELTAPISFRAGEIKGDPRALSVLLKEVAIRRK